jgi:hypothetical protein
LKPTAEDAGSIAGFEHGIDNSLEMYRTVH